MMKFTSLIFRLMVVLPVFWAFVTTPAGAQRGTGTESNPLALERVVLFKNGVGYFELKGKVMGGKGVALHFKRKEMNDLLKSLTVINLSQGQVNSVVYDSRKTIHQQLEDFGFDLSSKNGLPQVLRQFQGNAVTLTAGNTQATGQIIGVEKRLTIEEGRETPSFFLSILPHDGQMRSFRLDDITGIRFLSDELNDELARYLAIKSQGHLKDDKTLVITPSGEGIQHLMVSYVIEAPVWKATYRIVLPHKSKDRKPFVQGWAIVDNVTTQDWNHVNLSLVSGLPVSFIQNLYDPRFKKRPVLETEDAAGAAPAIPEVGMREEMVKVAAPMAMERLDREAVTQKHKSALKPTEPLGNGLRTMVAQTATRTVGELFEYHITHPVTITRNHSAMVPIIAADMDGQAVDIYNEDTRQENPLAAVKLINTTGLTLEGGPLTVISGDSYAGEAFMRTMKPGEHRYLPYAVDLSLRVNTKRGSKTESVDRVIINRGVIRMHRGIVETKTYHLNNHNDRIRTVIIEHPSHQGWELIDTPKPIEVTDNFLRFEVEAPPDQVTAFTVKEIRDAWKTMMISNLTPDDVVLFAREGYLQEAVKTQLDRLMHLKSEIARLDDTLDALDKERRRIFNDQKRLRDNLGSLGRTAEEKTLRSRYIKQMDLQETRLKAIDDEEKRLKTTREAKQRQLEEGIMALGQDLKI